LNPGFADGYLLRSQALVYFSGDIIVKDKTETSDKTFLRYKAAAESLEKFLELRGDNSVVDVWKEQLKSLKFYLSSSDKSRPVEVYVGRAVTTKARLMSKPIPEYPSQARNGGVSGTVVLKAVFAADGQVKHIIVVQSLPGGLTEASINAAKKIKFLPATLDGKPVSMWMQLEYNFGYR
jgi:TonB family protein